MRREYFPNYKYQRKQVRLETQETSDKWDMTFLISLILLLNMRLQRIFLHVFSVDNAEADDIIAILCREAHNNKEKVMIVSGDKDFIQLHKYDDKSI